jgi:hypothetical protein
VIGSHFVPQLGPESYHQIDSADGSSRLTQSRNCGNEIFSVARP